MVGIELVIKIPEGIMEYIKNNDCLAVAYGDEVAKAIKNGTPLPKGHGRLIDADTNIKELRKMEVSDDKDKQSVRFAIIELENAPTIVKADEECDYKGSCIDCPHNTEEDTEWFKQDEKQAESEE